MAFGALVALAGCERLQPNTPSPTEVLAQYEAKAHPLGRFVPAGTRQYSNGTEVYMLDTRNGQVCYALITNDGKPDTNVCTDPPAGAL